MDGEADAEEEVEVSHEEPKEDQLFPAVSNHLLRSYCSRLSKKMITNDIPPELLFQGLPKDYPEHSHVSVNRAFLKAGKNEGAGDDLLRSSDLDFRSCAIVGNSGSLTKTK